jgi:hypothetical protein
VLADLWDWVAGVFGRINDVSVYWLLLALALKAVESSATEPQGHRVKKEARRDAGRRGVTSARGLWGDRLERMQLVVAFANDAVTRLGDFVPGALQIAERLGDDDPALVRHVLQDGDLGVLVS